MPQTAVGWSSDAVEHYLERMGIAAELGMDASPGSLADEVACREAERVAECVPISVWPSDRGRLVMDAVIDAFKDMGVSYVGLLPDDPEGGTP